MIILEKFDSYADLLDTKATIYAEKYGIFNYIIVGNRMIWDEVLPTEGTFQHVVNLETMVEKSIQIKKGYWE